jgi:flagellar basal body P-ring formation protein FlgA
MKWSLTTALVMSVIVSSAFCETTIELKPRALAMSDTLKISDVAYISGGNEESGRVSDIGLGQAPILGSKRSVDKSDLRSALDSAGVDIAMIKFSGCEKSEVVRKTLEVTGDEVMEAANDFALENMPWDESEVIIEPGRTPSNITVPYGPVDIEIEEANMGDWAGYVILRAKILVDGRERERVRMRLKIRVFKEIYVSSKKLLKNHIITAGDVELKRIELTNKRVRDFVTDESEIIGRRVLRMVSSNKHIKGSNLGEPLMVRRDDVVTVVAQKGSIYIELTGQAMQDGSKGDIIKVRNINSKRIINAEVISDEKVSIPQ